MAKKKLTVQEKPYVAICNGVTDSMTCRFDGACYGVICIAPAICQKSEAELTKADRAQIKRFTSSEGR